MSPGLTLPKISTERIDKPGNRGNSGVYVHKIMGSNGQLFRLVEKKSTSSREKLFYTSCYTQARSFSPPITARVHALDFSKQANCQFSVFMEYCQPVSPAMLINKYSRELAKILADTTLLRIDAIRKYPTNVIHPANKTMKVFLKLCSEKSIKIDSSLIISIKKSRKKILSQIELLPYVAQHSDVKAANMGISSSIENDHLCLLDWGNFASRRMGYDFKNLYSFCSEDLECATEHLAEIGGEYLQLLGDKCLLKPLMLCALVAGANTRLTRFIRTKKPSFALQYFASMEAALRLAP